MTWKRVSSKEENRACHHSDNELLKFRKTSSTFCVKRLLIVNCFSFCLATSSCPCKINNVFSCSFSQKSSSFFLQTNNFLHHVKKILLFCSPQYLQSISLREPFLKDAFDSTCMRSSLP